MENSTNKLTEASLKEHQNLQNKDLEIYPNKINDEDEITSKIILIKYF